jgi:hypothetical protein
MNAMRRGRVGIGTRGRSFLVTVGPLRGLCDRRVGRSHVGWKARVPQQGQIELIVVSGVRECSLDASHVRLERSMGAAVDPDCLAGK